MQVVDNHLVLVNTLILTARPVVAMAAPAMLDININVNLGILLFVALATNAVRQLHKLLDVLLGRY